MTYLIWFHYILFVLFVVGFHGWKMEFLASSSYLSHVVLKSLRNSFEMLGNLALRGEYFTMGGDERVFLLSWRKDYFFYFPEQVCVIAFHALTKTFLELK